MKTIQPKSKQQQCLKKKLRACLEIVFPVAIASFFRKNGFSWKIFFASAEGRFETSQTTIRPRIVHWSSPRYTLTAGWYQSPATGKQSEKIAWMSRSWCLLTIFAESESFSNEWTKSPECHEINNTICYRLILVGWSIMLKTCPELLSEVHEWPESTPKQAVIFLAHSNNAKIFWAKLIPNYRLSSHKTLGFQALKNISFFFQQLQKEKPRNGKVCVTTVSSCVVMCSFDVRWGYKWRLLIQGWVSPWIFFMRPSFFPLRGTIETRHR